MADEREGPEQLQELDRQVERGALFMHASFDRIAARASGIEDRLVELIEVLEDKGVVAPTDLTPPAPAHPGPAPMPDQGVDAPPVQWPAIALRGQVGPPKPPVEVNCAERMHICHAICCKLNFALTAPEVDAGKVKFDLGFPYMIRHDADGYCTHNNRETGFCGVYADRPGICRHYSCAGDGRIWKDFDKMELNQEWLDANLGDAHRIRLRLDLPLMEG